MKIVGVTGFRGSGRLSGRGKLFFMGVRVGVENFFWITYRRYTDLSVIGVRVGVANFFLDKSIGIVENNTFQSVNR